MEHRVIADPGVVQEKIIAAKKQGSVIGVVPTMGALHEGHLSLVREAKEKTDFVVVTIFVNPTQFGPNEDFDKYPRTLEHDLEQLRLLDVDMVFTPTKETMYPTGHDCFVEVVELAKRHEGELRPTHYRGVTTVVLKLFNITQADYAFFGQKDYQQCCVVTRMATDLNLPIKIVVCPTVREPDGLAMSSRNRYLSAEERSQSLVLSQSLEKARQLLNSGMTDAAEIRRQMCKAIESAPLAKIDYVTLADPMTLEELSNLSVDRDAPIISGSTSEGARAVALLAVRFGNTRLIDNAILV